MKRKSILVGIILLVFCFVCGCGKKNSSSSVNVTDKTQDKLDIINNSDCDEELLDVIISNHAKCIQEKQIQNGGIKYSCISMYSNKELSMIDWPTDDEVEEILTDKYAFKETQNEEYILSVGKADDRFDTIKNSFFSVLIIRDKDDALLDTMVYEGAVSSRIKTIDDDIIWEVQEIQDIQCDYSNQDNKVVCKGKGVFNNKTYDIQISNGHLAKSIDEIGAEKDVYWEGKGEEKDELCCVYAENREITMKEIIGDKDLKESVINAEPFPMSIDKYGCPYRQTYSGIGGDIFVTKDGYVVISTSLSLEYYEMSREELDEMFRPSDVNYDRGRHGFIDTNKKLESVFVGGEENPRLLEN